MQTLSSAVKESNTPNLSISKVRGNFAQAKPIIGPVNSKYEREADAVADQVIQMPLSGADLSRNPSRVPLVQRKCSACSKEEKLWKKPIMRKGGGGETSTGMAALNSQLNRSKGGGKPLPTSTNRFMSRAFRADLSGVRVHTKTNAVQMNRDLSARAFTHGQDIYFNQGEFRPDSSAGKHLLAHELTHVMQQGAGGTLVQRQTTSTPAATPTLKFKTKSGPTPGKCGAYNWGIQWGLTAPAHTTNGGWIVQKVNFTVTGRKNLGGVNTFGDIGGNTGNIPYWEAWRVKPGESHSTLVTDYGASADDIWFSRRSVDNASGTITQTGKAEYYDNMVSAPAGMTANSHPYAGRLHATLTQPTGLTGGTGSIDHNLLSTWNCHSPSIALNSNVTVTPDP